MRARAKWSYMHMHTCTLCNKKRRKRKKEKNRGNAGEGEGDGALGLQVELGVKVVQETRVRAHEVSGLELPDTEKTKKEKKKKVLSSQRPGPHQVPKGAFGSAMGEKKREKHKN